MLFDKERKSSDWTRRVGELDRGFHPFVNTATLNIDYADFYLLEKAEHTVKEFAASQAWEESFRNFSPSLSKFSRNLL